MNLVLIILGLLALGFVLRSVLLARPGLPLESAKAALKSGQAVLVDVREPDEWKGGVAKQAALLPLSDLRGARLLWAPFLTQNRGKQLLVYCRSGNRSGLAAASLRREGVDCLNVGSLRDWDRAGWPICTPRGLR